MGNNNMVNEKFILVTLDVEYERNIMINTDKIVDVFDEEDTTILTLDYNKQYHIKESAEEVRNMIKGMATSEPITNPYPYPYNPAPITPLPNNPITPGTAPYLGDIYYGIDTAELNISGGTISVMDGSSFTTTTTGYFDGSKLTTSVAGEL